MDEQYEIFREYLENCSKYPYKLSEKVFCENSLEKCLLNYIAACELGSDNKTKCLECNIQSATEG